MQTPATTDRAIMGSLKRKRDDPGADVVPATIVYLKRGDLSILSAISAELPDVFTEHLLPKLELTDTLNLAQVKPGDVLYDLGSGDGRIPVTAARRFGVRATGIDIDPVRIREANANAEEAGVTDLVTFKQEDLFKTDFSDATVVTLYLLDSLNEKLRPRLLNELAPGTRIVSHAFRMGDWEPEQTVEVGDSTIFLWTVPAR